MSGSILTIAKALQSYGVTGERAIKSAIDLLIQFGASAEVAAKSLDKLNEAYNAALHQPLPRHQTSLVRLNYHANGGDDGHLRVD